MQKQKQQLGVNMGRYLDPKADIVFKRIFQDHPDLLKSFLNAVLPLPEDNPIVSLEYLPPEQVPIIPGLKRTIADVRCRDKEKRSFIVEMQIEWADYFTNRLLFESSQAYVKQLRQGESFRLLEPVYGLGIIATNFDPSEIWYHHYQLVNVEKPQREIIDGLQLIFIELQKMPVIATDLKRLQLLWLRFLRDINEKTKKVAPELLAVPEISQALELAEEAAYTDGEMQAYEFFWNTISSERAGWDEWYDKGLKKGRAEEHEKMHIIAQRLRASGMSENEITRITRL